MGLQRKESALSINDEPLQTTATLCVAASTVDRYPSEWKVGEKNKQNISA